MSSTKAAERKAISTGEALLADDEDAPSSFAILKDLVIAGVNESEASRKKTGDNHHLRTFRLQMSNGEKNEETTIKKCLEHQIYPDLSIEEDDYQRTTKISPDGKYLALLSKGGIPALVDAANMTRIDTELLNTDDKGEPLRLVDLEFAKDSLWIATSEFVRIISLPVGEQVTDIFSITESSVPKNFFLTKMLILGPDMVLLAMNDPKLNQGFLALHRIYKGGLRQEVVSFCSSRVRGIYVNTKTPGPTLAQLIVATFADGSVSIYDKDLDKRKTWKKLHQFPISTVAIRGDGKEMVTCSIDEKVNVLDITDLRPATGPLTILMRIVMVILFLVLCNEFRHGTHEYYMNALDDFFTRRNRPIVEL